MRLTVRTQLFFNRLKRRYRQGADRGLYQVSALIRKEARESMRVRARTARARAGRRRRSETGSSGSPSGQPPYAYTRAGLREINFHVQWPKSIIGPRKFRNSKFFNRPVPNIHEIGGIAVAGGWRQRYTARYPERSFMWRAVTELKKKNKIQSRFNVTLRSSW